MCIVLGGWNLYNAPLDLTRIIIIALLPVAHARLIRCVFVFKSNCTGIEISLK